MVAAPAATLAATSHAVLGASAGAEGKCVDPGAGYSAALAYC
jgi:hypothetical protein